MRAGGDPVEVTVGARLIVHPGTVISKARSDATGWYRLQLPVGTYKIEINPSDGGYTGPLQDTVQVGPRTRRLDLLRGRVAIQLVTAANLEGRVVSCSLDPLESYRSTTSVTGTAVHDARVTFHFTLVHAGLYRVRLGANPNFWLPGTYDQETADLFRVPVDRPVVFEGVLDRSASISGTVRGSWQIAYQSTPDVEAFSLEGKRIGRAFVTQDGSFRLDLWAAQPVKLRVENRGIEQWIGGESPETATVFAPQPGEHLHGISLVDSGILCHLEGPGFLSYHRAEVLLCDEDGRTFRPYVYGENPIPISNLRPGRYALYVYGYCAYDVQGWGSQWYDGADSLAAATTIDLLPGELVPVTVHLVAGAAVEGRVLASNGLPASWVSLVLFDHRHEFLCDSGWRSFIEGSFSLPGLGNGDYYLAAQTPSGPWWYPGTANQDLAQVIQIRDHVTVRVIEWRLPGNAEGAAP